MSARPRCCLEGNGSHNDHGNAGLPRPRPGRGRVIGSWVLPAATLALLPKCPACLAAYVALATGIGVSTTVAGYLRAALVAASVAFLCFLAVRHLQRRVLRDR